MSLITELKDLLETKGYTLSFAAKAMNMSIATLHLWMNENYKGNVSKINDAVSRFIKLEKMRESNVKINFVKTTIASDIFDIAHTCHVENEIGVCYGDAGLGKTFAVKRYTMENPDTIFIEADLGYTPKVLFSEIHKEIGLDGKGTVHSMLDAIINKLRASGRLIIVDEAEHLPYKSLELLRRVYDKANVGILLVGMPKLIMNLKGDDSQYKQLYSRVGIVSKLKKLTNSDIKDIISNITSDSKCIYPILSTESAGNTRVLTKLLVRALRLAEINERPLDSELVKASVKQIIR